MTRPGFAWCAYWLGLVALACLMLASGPTRAASTTSYDVGYAGFEKGTNINQQPTGWLCSPACLVRAASYAGGTNKVAPANMGNTLSCGDGGNYASAYCAISYDLTFMSAGEKQSANYSWALQMYNPYPSALTYQYKMEFINSGNTVIGSNIGSCTVSSLGVDGNSVTCPSLVGSIPATSARMQATVVPPPNSNGSFAYLDNVQPILIAYTPGCTSGCTSSGGGTSTTGGGSTYAGPQDANWSSPGGAEVLSSLQSMESAISNPVCGNGASIVGKISNVADTIGSVGALVSGLFGGGGQVVVLLKMLADGKKQIQAQQQILCEGVETAARLTDVKSLLSNPKAYVGILTNLAAMGDSKTATLATQVSASLDAFPTGASDLVTAANQANTLTVATAKMQAAEFDRMLGGVHQDYETASGPRLTTTRIKAAGGGGASGGDGSVAKNFEFGEGEYKGSMARIDQLNDAEADPTRFYNLAPVMAASPSCASSYPAPTTTGNKVNDALAVVQWNTRQTVLASKSGTFMCNLFNHTPRAATSVCFGPDQAINMHVGNKTMPLIAGGKFCVYGPATPSYIVTLMKILPSVLMLTAVVGGIRFFL